MPQQALEATRDLLPHLNPIRWQRARIKGAWLRVIFNAALAEGILIAPGAMFSNAGRFEHFIRLNCGWPYNREIESAVQRLGQLCANIGAAR